MNTHNYINDIIFILGTVVLTVITIIEIVFVVNTFLLSPKSTSTSPLSSTSTPTSVVPQFSFLNKKEKTIDILDVNGKKNKTIYKIDSPNNLVSAKYCSNKKRAAFIDRSVIGSIVTTNLTVVNLNTNEKNTIDTKSYDSLNKSSFSEISYIDNFSFNCDYMIYTTSAGGNCTSGVFSFLTNQLIRSSGCHNLFWSPNSDYLFNITRSFPGFLRFKFGFITRDELVTQFGKSSKTLEINSYDLSKVIINWSDEMSVFPSAFFTEANKIVLFPYGADSRTVYNTDPVVFDFTNGSTEQYFGSFRPREDLGALNFVNNNRVFLDTSGVTTNEINKDFIYEYVDNWRKSDYTSTNVHSQDYGFAGWAE